MVYFGHGAYGVEAASQIFFQKHVGEVNLPEAALLAAIVNGPGYYSPFYDMDAALRRRNFVLRRMLELGYITQPQYEEAVATPIELRTAGGRAIAVLRHVRQDQLIDRYGAQMVYGRPAGLHHPGPGDAAGCRAGHRSHGACQKRMKTAWPSPKRRW